MDEKEVKNIFVNFEDGDNMLVYTYELTEEEVTAWANRACAPNKVVEAYHVPQDQLQYYCIGGRVWADTPEQVAKVRKYLAAL